MVPCIEMAVKLCSVFLSKEGEICCIILTRPTAPTLLFGGKNQFFSLIHWPVLQDILTDGQKL